MERVIVGPLKASHIRTLVIIDALDECKDKEPASAILSVLSHYTDVIPRVKFFITGRPEPRIRSGFRLESLQPITEVLRLHDVERSLVDSDIKLFLRTQLVAIAKTQSNLSREYARTYCCPTRGIVFGLSRVGMVGMKGVVGGSEGRRGEWGDRS